MTVRAEDWENACHELVWKTDPEKFEHIRDLAEQYSNEGEQEPVGYFVKDFADGFIFFENYDDAYSEVRDTGALILVAYKVPG